MRRSTSDSGAASRSRPFGRLRDAFVGKSLRQPKTPTSPTIEQAPVQKFVQELESIPAALPTTAAPDSGPSPSEYDCYKQLCNNTSCLRAASLAAAKIDSALEVYSRCRRESIAACREMVDECQSSSSSSTTKQASFQMDGGQLVPIYRMNQLWISAIWDFITFQELLIEVLKVYIVSIFQKYSPEAPQLEAERFVKDKNFRWETISRMLREDLPISQPDPQFWQSYVNKVSKYDIVHEDLEEMRKVLNMAHNTGSPKRSIEEHVIASNGDVILEFSKDQSHRTLRFRVSSHMLVETSPYFARILLGAASRCSAPPPPQLSGFDTPRSQFKELCKDGMEVVVYQMPQAETNNNDALAIMLHAAHMHNDKIPRHISLDEFVNIAEVCLRYRCTSPLEMAVEYRWLPEWVHKASDESPDDLLFISYVFGIPELFTRTSKSAILNMKDDSELQARASWPTSVKEKIRAVRFAKISQIYAACSSAIGDYCQPATESIETIGEGLNSIPRCPKGSHQCDATNLGWLMLFFSELGILPHVMSNNVNGAPKSVPQRSIKQLLDQLRNVPAAPQIHPGICDRAPSFRMTMNDVFNSVEGLTLRDVSGVSGWALSKSDSSNEEEFTDKEVANGIYELAAPLHEHTSDLRMADERIMLKILKLLDTPRDLHAAAMINKAFYGVYRKHELMLMRSLIRAGALQAPPSFPDTQNEAGISRTNTSTDGTRTTNHSIPPIPSLRREHTEPARPVHIYDGAINPSSEYRLSTEVQLSVEEIEKILWPESQRPPRPSASFPNFDPEGNSKFLARDFVRGDKALVVEGTKHLQEERDRNLRVGMPASRS